MKDWKPMVMPFLIAMLIIAAMKYADRKGYERGVRLSNASPKHQPQALSDSSGRCSLDGGETWFPQRADGWCMAVDSWMAK